METVQKYRGRIAVAVTAIGALIADAIGILDAISAELAAIATALGG